MSEEKELLEKIAKIVGLSKEEIELGAKVTDLLKWEGAISKAQARADKTAEKHLKLTKEVANVKKVLKGDVDFVISDAKFYLAEIEKLKSKFSELGVKPPPTVKGTEATMKKAIHFMKLIEKNTLK